MSLQYSLVFVVLSFCQAINAQITADFTAENSSGCPPFALQLTDNSTAGNAIASWDWTINGGFLSNQQSPAILLNNPGFYTVCLTVTDGNNNSDIECRNNYIQVFEPPTALFTTNLEEGCIPFGVEFSNSSELGSAAIAEVIWDFGGSCGVIVAGPQEIITCNYEGAGSFQVSMIVTDQNGCRSNLIAPNHITANAPPAITAVIPAYNDCQPPFQIDFGNAGPNNPDVIYNWDFGNGQTFTGQNPDVITYTGSGPYSISITAENQVTGCTNDLQLEGAIFESNPIQFSFSRMNNCGIPEVSFTDESIGSADAITWDFGDGNNSSLVNPIHNYAAFGCYTVVLTRTVGGCTKSLSREVCIAEISAPAVNAAISNLNGCVLPHSANFTLSGNPNLTYLWDFGDGNTSTQQLSSHVYVDYGNYEVTILVTDALGCEELIIVDTVEVQPLSLSMGLQQGCSPLIVDFDPQINSFSTITSYDWTVTDGGGAVIFQSSAPNPAFSFVNLGCYDVNVVITNQEGCQFSETLSDRFCVGTAPNPAFSVDPLVGCASQTFSFTDNSTGNVNSWSWDFQSDGAEDSFASNPDHTYDELGCYDATLTVANFGCEASTSVGPICIEPPFAAFIIDVDCDIPTQVTFINSSQGADSLIWDFGVLNSDTDTSTIVNPVFNYPALGTYNATLITYNFTTDCSDTTNLEIILTIPSASFTLDTLNYCRPAVLNPVNTSIGAESYFWTLPDGGVIDDPDITSPEISFPESGIYSIHLSLITSNDCTAEFLVENIRVNGPEPEFYFSVSQDCVPFEAAFVDASSNLLSENISWQWNIEELNLTSEIQNPNFNLDTSGIFTVSLEVEDADGCTALISRSLGLNEGSPVAYFAGDLFGCEGITNSFLDFSVGNNIQYSWDFGDGSQSLEQNPTHEFDLGDYQVCLTIEDANCIDTHCELVQIQEVVADFLVDESYISCAPSPVNFINNSQNAQGFLWNYGDGTADVAIDEASHIYNLEGIYDVGLIAIGNNPACQDTILVEDAVLMTGPLANFDYSIDDFCIPAELSLNIDSDRNYNFLVFYGDGNSVEMNSEGILNLTHVYDFPTTDGYVPTILVVEEEGCELLLEGMDTIRLSALEFDFESDRSLLCDEDRSVVFESTIESSEDNYEIEWQFENGYPETSTQPDLSVTYVELGAHNVQLKVSNENCIDSILMEALVEVYEIAEISTPSYEICLGDTIELMAVGNTDYFSWSPGEMIDDPTAANAMIIPEESITLTVSGAIGPCPEVSGTSEIIVNELPTIEMENFHVYFPGQTFELGPIPDPSLNYYWYPDDLLSCSFCPNPIFMGDSIGDFRIRVTNPETECFNEDIVQVRSYSQCPDNTFYVPNVFSPNGDGQNDVLKIEYALLDDIEVMRIYDRWGNLIWETDDLTASWDGTFKGKPMNPGVYVFMIQANCSIDGRTFIKHGDITLMR